MPGPDAPPDAGRLRHRVTWLQMTKAPTADSRGEEVATYTPAGTFWAAVEPLGGDEPFVAAQEVPARRHRIRMRAVGAIAPDDRLLFEGRTLTVNSAFRVRETNAWLEIAATEGPAAPA